MNRKQLERLLTDSGFTPRRHVRHGTLWSDGLSDVLLGRGVPVNRNLQNFMQDVRNAVKRREGLPNRPVGVNVHVEFKKIEEPEMTAAPLTAKLGDFGSLAVRKKPAGEDRSTPIEPKKPEPKTIEWSIGDEEEDEPMQQPSLVRYDNRPPAHKPPPVIVSPPPKEEPSEPREPKFRKFPKEELEYIRGRIRYLRAQSVGPTAIAETLRKEGLLMPDGKMGVTNQWVNNCIQNMRIQGILDGGPKIPAPMTKIVTPPEPPKPDPEPAPVPVLAAPEPEPAPPPPAPAPKPASPQRKLPDSVMNILTDPDLTDRQKVVMISAWAGLV